MELLEHYLKKISTLLKNPNEEPSYISRLNRLLSSIHREVWLECPNESYLDVNILPIFIETKQVAERLKAGTGLALHTDVILENLQRYRSGLPSDCIGIMKGRGLTKLACS